MCHAGLGRFTQRDPAGYMDGANLYAYVANNPIAFIDPSGMTLRDLNPYTDSTLTMYDFAPIADK